MNHQPPSQTQATKKTPWGILGAGAWGIALACKALRAGTPICLWGRIAQEGTLEKKREALKKKIEKKIMDYAKEQGAEVWAFLQTQETQGKLSFTPHLEEILAFSSNLFWAVPVQSVPLVAKEVAKSQMMRNFAPLHHSCSKGKTISPHFIEKKATWILTSKGLQIHPLAWRESECMSAEGKTSAWAWDIKQRLSGQGLSTLFPWVALGALSGPNLAHQTMEGFPLGMTLASAHKEVWERVSACFSKEESGEGDIFLEFSLDFQGVQLVGALKNVMALGYGMTDVLYPADNTRALYLTLAAQEMSHCLDFLGLETQTVHGYAGWGDLWVSCLGGRNAQLGRHWVQDKTMQENLTHYFQNLTTKAEEPSPGKALAEGFLTLKALEAFLSHHQDRFPLMQGLLKTAQGSITPKEYLGQLFLMPSRHSTLLTLPFFQRKKPPNFVS